MELNYNRELVLAAYLSGGKAVWSPGVVNTRKRK